MMRTRRRTRSDCNYIIYEMIDEQGNNYIGLTRKSLPNANKVVLERWRKHKSRARCENRQWVLYQYLKDGGIELAWMHRILEIVRGRKAAYARERELVLALEPTLNDQYLG